MKDGLYQVTTKYFCAGFVIAGGKVIQCAPILRKKISYWMTVAKFVCTISKEDETIIKILNDGR